MTCSLCDADADACEAVSGCSYKADTSTPDVGCKASPSTGACSNFNWFPAACVANDTDSCVAYNEDDGTCLDTLPDVSGSVTCSNLDGLEELCNGVNAGSGKGANDLGCAYESDDTGCLDVVAFSSDCSVYHTLEKPCEA